MKIVFLSNFFNHHQAFLSDELNRITEGNYVFIETSAIPRERLEMGYSREKREYVRSGEGDCGTTGLIEAADLVISGSAPERWICRRIRAGKLVLRYSERPLKLGTQWWKYPYRFIKWHWQNPPGKAVYLLCAGAYTAGDYAKFGLFRNRAYRWGYFPETKRYDSIATLLSRKHPADILWCGRFLDWKHPEDAVTAVRKLKEEGYSLRLRLIGSGTQEETLRTMVKEYGLEECVEFLGTMTPQQVRGHMEQAGVFLFTSDRMEGWGAVLNEAMNSGCAVVASHAIGSVPYLLKDGKNGLVYPSGDVRMLCEKVKDLLDHPEKQKQLGKAAYETIINEWNAETAAERVAALAQAIAEGEKSPDLYQSGPCSRAENLCDDWI